jgi:hypothetical protein
MTGKRRPTTAPAAPMAGWVVVLSIVAIVISAAAIALTLVRGGSPSNGAGDGCRTLAWSALPDGAGLPDGWTVSAGNFYADGAGDSLVGPAAADGSAPDTLYLQVTCYGADGHLAMTRSHDSALSAGAEDSPLIKLGEESFAIDDSSNGSTSVYIRRAGLVAVLVAPSTLDPADLEQVARAVDVGLSGAGSTAVRPPSTARPPVASPSGGIDLPSDLPSDEPTDEPSSTPAHAAPELEALLPKVVAGVAFTRRSTVGTDLDGSDPASAALVAALDKLGKSPADLRIAAGYDESGATDLYLYAFQVTGVKGATLGQALVDSYVAVGASGITTATTTISGKQVTHVMYSDGLDDYVYVHGDTVFDVSTSDQASAIQALAALP